MGLGGVAVVAALTICSAAVGLGPAEAVTMISDARATLTDFARNQGQDPNLYEIRYGATGMLVCSGTYSTAQLTVRNNLITTAAHAFYDPRGAARGDLSACVFSISSGGVNYRIPIDVTTLRVGSKTPFAVSPVNDWAVVRLMQSVPNSHPYMLGPSGRPGTSIVMLAHRHRGWVHDGRRAIETCSIRMAERIQADSPREIGIDCSAGEGASGSALMRPGATPTMLGIYVGWRSSHPDTSGPYSPTHMNFGVAVEGPFRAAILASSAEAASR